MVASIFGNEGILRRLVTMLEAQVQKRPSERSPNLTYVLGSADQFEQFVMGFNQAAPLFSFVDVGIGKEAADSKIKGKLSRISLSIGSN